MSICIDQTFAALADPTRRAIIARLAKGEAHVSELSRPFLKRMSPPAVTKHLKVLEKAGLITKGRDKQFRPCRLNGKALKEAADWIDTYKAFWEESFDRLDAYLKTVAPSASAASDTKATTKGKDHDTQARGK